MDDQEHRWISDQGAAFCVRCNGPKGRVGEVCYGPLPQYVSVLQGREVLNEWAFGDDADKLEKGRLLMLLSQLVAALNGGVDWRMRAASARESTDD